MNRAGLGAVFAALLAAAASADVRRPVVAIAEVRIPTPAGQLQFSEDGVRDLLTAALNAVDAVQVMDWNRLAAVAFRRNLESSDLAAGRNDGSPGGDVLLNDYFLLCTVSHYSEQVRYQSRVVSKSKSQIADIELQLLLKDARTNEVVASAKGSAQKQRKVTQRAGFGAGGGAVSTLAKDALHEALKNALDDLVRQAFGAHNQQNGNIGGK